jgi:transposase-like protein
MAKTQCTICAHKARKKIDAALVLPGASLRGIAATFGISEDALRRHVKNGHVSAKIAQAQQAQDVVEADDLLKEIQEIHGHQKAIFTEARNRTIEGCKTPDNKLALEALRDQSKIIELKGKVLGSFIKDKEEKPATNPPLITMTPESMKAIGDILAKQKKV